MTYVPRKPSDADLLSAAATIAQAASTLGIMEAALARILDICEENADEILLEIQTIVNQGLAG